MRRVDAGVFAGAQRFHKGLLPGEFPAILEKGERVIPKGGQMPVPVVNVNVQNNNGGEASVQQRQSGNALDIDIVIDQKTAKNMGRSGSATSRTMRGVYGARPPLVRT